MCVDAGGGLMVVGSDSVELFFAKQVVVQECAREVWVWAASWQGNKRCEAEFQVCDASGELVFFGWG